jgi:hypothetical protein
MTTIDLPLAPGLLAARDIPADELPALLEWMNANSREGTDTPAPPSFFAYAAAVGREEAANPRVGPATRRQWLIYARRMQTEADRLAGRPQQKSEARILAFPSRGGR